MLADAKEQSIKNEAARNKKEAEDKAAKAAAEAAKKKDDEENKKESKVNRFTGLYHNEDGTRQFKELGAKKG